MSESIPLHKLRKFKNRRTAREDITISPDVDTMPQAATAKAIVAARRNREYSLGRRNGRYSDDPEEHEGLLDSSEGDDNEISRDSPVRILQITYWSSNLDSGESTPEESFYQSER